MSFDHKQNQIIANFLGIPLHERSAANIKEPNPLSDILDQVRDTYGFDQPSAEQMLVDNWADIFGTLSERCFPVRINQKKTLVVSVANPTLRSEITFQKALYLKKINSLMQCSTIKDINIIG